MNAPRLWQALAWLIAAGFCAVVLLMLAGSLGWPVEHDLPLMLYDGWLVLATGRAPYREIFEMNAPGVFLIYGFIDALTGGRDLAVRLVDIVLMVTLSATTVLAMRRHGLRAGLIASSVYLFGYLKLGPDVALQREALAMVPLAMSLYLALETSTRHAMRHQFVLGILAAVACAIKPSFLPAWLVLSVALAARAGHAMPAGGPRRGALLGAAASFIGGAGLIGVGLLIWLARVGALGEFLGAAWNYWPLYAQLNETAHLAPYPGAARWVVSMLGATLSTTQGTLGAYQFVPFTFAAGGGLLSLGLHATNRERVIEVCALVALLLAVAAHVSLSNKYWVYHYLPARYVVAVLAGLLFSERAHKNSSPAWVPLLLATVLVVSGTQATAGWPPFAFYRTADAAAAAAAVKQGDVSAIERYLREHLEADDRVLPLDVTGGAVHAMYRTHALLAGRFLYSFHFYHHVSSPVIQQLRGEIVGLLERQPPRLVVEFPNEWRPSGPDCTEDFPALDSLLASRYRVAVTSRRFRILERRDEDTHTSDSVR